MPGPYRFIDVNRNGDVFCVRLKRSRLDEDELYEMCGELIRLLEEDGCCKMALSLGPPDPEFLYSIFLAKLVSLQRRLREQGGALQLARVSPVTRQIFEACRLDQLFEFAADEDSAVAALTA